MLEEKVWNRANYPDDNLLNKRSEIIAKCRHRRKHKINPFDTSVTLHLFCIFFNKFFSILILAGDCLRTTWNSEYWKRPKRNKVSFFFSKIWNMKYNYWIFEHNGICTVTIIMFYFVFLYLSAVNERDVGLLYIQGRI